MSKHVAIVQSNYVPWKGYFDLIAAVDEFVLLDDVQFTTRDWRNRNQIKTPQGLQWLTIPVGSDRNRRIRDVHATEAWREKHWKAIQMNYSKAPYFIEVSELLHPIYMNHQVTQLSQINYDFINGICRYLGIETKISFSWEYKLSDDPTERLASICSQLQATTYISGPSAKDYLNESVFTNKQISVEWFDYAGYPEYPQLWGPFAHNVSIIDLLFNCGQRSVHFMRCSQK